MLRDSILRITEFRFGIRVDIAKKIKNGGIYNKPSREAKGASVVISTRNLFTSQVEITRSRRRWDLAISLSRRWKLPPGNAKLGYNTTPDMNRSSEVANVCDVRPLESERERDLEGTSIYHRQGYIDTLVHTVRTT